MAGRWKMNFFSWFRGRVSRYLNTLVEDDLDYLSLLPPSPEHCDCRHVLSHLPHSVIIMPGKYSAELKFNLKGEFLSIFSINPVTAM